VSGARQAVLDFFTAFNAGDADGTIETLNHPHIFMAPGGGFLLSEDASEGPRPNFEQMRQRENWHMSIIDALEASIVTRDKVHVELTFTRWHPDGTRYWTVPALWIVTRAGDHWGIQVRSLMPATFDQRAN
jgi:ketosteroid isomerase-like protein